MKLILTPTSPFARKVRVAASELGIALDLVPCAVHPIARDLEVVALNPLGQVPTLVSDDGEAIFDSRVICRYLNIHAGGRLYPDGVTGTTALVEEALAMGLLDAAALIRIEDAMRPPEKRWSDWRTTLVAKITSALDRLEKTSVPTLAQRTDIGAISIACALGYLDFRFADLDWREGRQALASWFADFDARPSMRSTPSGAPL